MKNFLWISILLASVVAAQAGVLMVQETTTGKSGKAVVSRFLLDGKAVRMEVEGTDRALVIYRADRKVFWMCDPKAKTYTEMTKQDVERMASQADSAMAQMQEQLKDMPAEQRAMVEKMMKKQAGGVKAEPARKYVRKATGEKVGKWKADRFEWAQGDRQETIWAAPAGNLGIGASDMTALKDMSSFFSKMAKGRTRGLAYDREEAGVKGVPVQARFKEGSVVTVTVLKEVAKVDHPPSVFEIPQGYKRVKP